MGNLSQQGHGGSLCDEYCFSICVRHSPHDMLTLVGRSGLVSPNAGKGGLPGGFWYKALLLFFQWLSLVITLWPFFTGLLMCWLPHNGGFLVLNFVGWVHLLYVYK